MIEVVSPGNKSRQNYSRKFLQKATDLIDHQIHLLIIDILRPGPRDSHSVHFAIPGDISDEKNEFPTGKPFTFAAYESDIAVRAYVEHVAVGDKLPEMPLFLRPRAYVEMLLKTTYQSAFNAVPRR